MFSAYIGMGSNLDDPLQQLQVATRRLAELSVSRCMRVSAFYRNPAMWAPGLPEQPDFVNAVARIDVQLTPHALLAQLHTIEAQHQRRRDDGMRWGPRTLDLDLLVYADSIINDERLSLPHPGLEYRPFVVLPLAEIEPQLIIPGRGRVAELASRHDGTQLQRIDPWADNVSV